MTADCPSRRILQRLSTHTAVAMALLITPGPSCADTVRSVESRSISRPAEVRPSLSAPVPAGGVWREDFEKPADQNWMLIGGAKIVAGGDGRCLASDGAGAGVWKTGELGDMSVELRYRHSDGTGVIALRRAVGDQPQYMYRVSLTQNGIAVGRVVRRDFVELGAGPCLLKAGQWYRINVDLVGGQISVKVDGRQVAAANDPEPLSKGLIAFGSLAGGVFGFDDIVLSSSELAPAPQAAAAMPAPRSSSAVGARPSAESGSARALPGGSVQGPSTVPTSRRRADTSPRGLQAAAQPEDVAGLLQQSGITQSQLAVLRQLDLDSPAGLAAYKGREEDLYRVIARVSARTGGAAPSKSQVAGWVSTASSRSVAPPSGRDSRLLAAKMRPSRPLSVAYWNPSIAVFPSPPRNASQARRAGLATTVLGQLTTPFELKPGQKDLIKDFAAPEPGLYRADISFARQGGFVTMQWRVERSDGAPVVQGGEPIEILDVIKGRTANYVFFWLTAQDIAGGKPMRFHIAVSRNENYKAPAKTGDTIEQQPTAVTSTDPTITGTLSVSRQAPIRIEQIGRADVPILNKPDPNQVNYPLQYLEMPYYKPVPRPSTVQFPLEVMLTPDPNTYRDPYVENGVTKSDPGIVWQALQVMCDDKIVTGGQTSSLQGITKYKLGNPGPGAYRIIVWPADYKLQDLLTTGIVWDLSTGIYKPIKRIIVDARLDGGKMPEACVAELWRLEVSGQSEPDSDGNDTGEGEFKLESNTIMARVPVDAAEQKYLDQNPQAWLKDHPVMVTRSVYPEFKHINMPGYSNLTCYPGKLLGWWIDSDADVANRVFSVFSTVVEDDDLTWWQEYGDCVTFLVKTVVSVIKAAYGGDISGIANVFKDAITDSMGASGWGMQPVDDVMGYTVYSSSKNQGYGLLRPGEAGYATVRQFNAEGNGKPELIDTASAPPPAPGAHIPANVSTKIGSLQPWASTGISIRKAPVLWSRRMRVQLLEFRVTYDFALRQATGPNNTTWWPITIYSTLGKTVLEYFSINNLPDYKMPIVKCTRPPISVGSQPDNWERVPARYFEVGLWESESGGDAFAGIVSTTVYPADFLTAAAASPQAAKPIPLDQAAKDAFLRGDMDEVRNNSHVIFYKSGPDFVGDFSIRDPGYHLDYVKFRVFMEIWGV